MVNRLCYISRNYRGTGSAGNKAKTDNEDTLAAAGATNLGLQRTLYHSKILTFLLDLAGIFKFVFCVRPGDVILLQYPVKKYFSFICRVAHLRGATTVALIHDLGSFRRKKLTVDKEIRRLMNADGVIASNDIMRQWLQSNGYSRPLGALGLFDYRSTTHHTARRTMRQPLRLVYAGGLAMRKNAFLLRLAAQPLPYELHIYGNRSGLPAMKDNERIVFHQFTPADEFIASVDADFGLVWDGDSTDSCTGDFGEYLRYNSPHKASFYLRSSLPVITWRQAAIAPIIESQGAGLAVDSLDQLEERLGALTEEQLDTMRHSACRLAEALDSGWFLLSALMQIGNNLELDLSVTLKQLQES
jgi:hypothetical protein